jgi:hypothetical protein
MDELQSGWPCDLAAILQPPGLLEFGTRLHGGSVRHLDVLHATDNRAATKASDDSGYPKQESRTEAKSVSPRGSTGNHDKGAIIVIV